MNDTAARRLALGRNAAAWSAALAVVCLGVAGAASAKEKDERGKPGTEARRDHCRGLQIDCYTGVFGKCEGAEDEAHQACLEDETRSCDAKFGKGSPCETVPRIAEGLRRSERARSATRASAGGADCGARCAEQCVGVGNLASSCAVRCMLACQGPTRPGPSPGLARPRAGSGHPAGVGPVPGTGLRAFAAEADRGSPGSPERDRFCERKLRTCGDEIEKHCAEKHRGDVDAGSDCIYEGLLGCHALWGNDSRCRRMPQIQSTPMNPSRTSAPTTRNPARPERAFGSGRTAPPPRQGPEGRAGESAKKAGGRASDALRAPSTGIQLERQE